MADGIKACCKDENNLVVKESGKKDVVLRVCSVCGCRHFELSAEPIRVGINLKGLS